MRVPFFASQWVARRLIAAGQGGSIVTTASLAGVIGNAAVEYGASKAAVINMTKSLGCRHRHTPGTEYARRDLSLDFTIRPDLARRHS
jgi:NAD(P)-dependent dehydrogenase (short-subunit alcohol dehydrogenase family)